MNCFTCERNLSAYVDDELSPETRLEVEAHLAECEKCRQDYETHVVAWEAAGRLRPEAAPGDLWREIESELANSGSSTTTDDLALIVRGLAEEVRDLKRSVELLRQDVASVRPAAETEGGPERDEVRENIYLWTGPGREARRQRGTA